MKSCSSSSDTFSLLREGPRAAHGPPDRDAREDQHRGRGLPPSEAERRPDRRRKAEEAQGLVAARAAPGTTERDRADGGDRRQQPGRFEPLRARPSGPGPVRPQHQCGRYHDGPAGVAEPPGEPQARVLRPAREAPEAEARHADRGADRGGDQPREREELEDIPRPIERGGPAGEPPHQLGARPFPRACCRARSRAMSPGCPPW